MAKKTTLDGLAALVSKGFASADKKFVALAEDIADLRKDMATKDDVREIVREELKPIETHLASVEGKVAGIDRRLDVEAMRRDDEKIPARVDKIEKHLGLDKQVRA
jgi:septal ring factor EnvC (AmiA/AmiB activator)